MKKLTCGILALVLCLCISAALAQEEISVPEVAWTFEVSLTTLNSSALQLVNNDNLLDADYEPENLVKVTDVKRANATAVYMDETAAEALVDMFNAAKQITSYTYTTESGNQEEATFEEGMTLYLKSGYLSYGTQATAYANYLARNNNVDNGEVAKPGASEHQTGLCADILNADYAARATMTQDFQWTPEAQWMKENCTQFGFILRYGENAPASMGASFEPWHFRYVGRDAAWYITDKGITLEQFNSEALFAIAQFEGAGGNIDEQIAYEFAKQSAPPMSYVLDEYGEDGDAEVSLVF